MKQEEKKSKTEFPESIKRSSQGDISMVTKEKLQFSEYEKLLYKQGIELVKLQEWVKQKKLKVVVIFEGRDAAGKGGAIKTIEQFLNPRICKIVALGVPTEKEK